MIYNTQFIQNPVTFCSPPPAGLGRTLVVEDRQLFYRMINSGALRQKGGYFSVQKKGGGRISFCQILDNHKVIQNGADVLLAANSGACAARVGIDTPPASDFANWFPAFYLPWEAGQAIRVTLKDPADTVRFFFTSTVDGCSVIVEGSPEAPTVYHLNDSGGGGNPPDIGAPQAQQNAYWRPKQQTMVAKFTAIRSPKSIKSPGTIAPPVQAKGIHARRYMDLTATHRAGLDTMPLYVARLADAQQMRPDATAWNFYGTEYKPYGTVFGWKQAKTWRFFYQKRAIMMYLYRASFPGGDIRGETVQVVTQLSWHLNEFWPNGSGIAHAKGLVP